MPAHQAPGPDASTEQQALAKGDGNGLLNQHLGWKQRLGLGGAFRGTVPQQTSVQRAAVPGRVNRQRKAAEAVGRALIEQPDAGA